MSRTKFFYSLVEILVNAACITGIVFGPDSIHRLCWVGFALCTYSMSIYLIIGMWQRFRATEKLRSGV